MSYIDPERFSVNQRKNLQTLHFSKMKTRNFDDQLNSCVPAICTYNPNFEAISTNKSRKLNSFYLDLVKPDENHKKNYLLVQKMWRSYNVSIDYSTVNFKSFPVTIKCKNDEIMF